MIIIKLPSEYTWNSDFLLHVRLNASTLTFNTSFFISFWPRSRGAMSQNEFLKMLHFIETRFPVCFWNLCMYVHFFTIFSCLKIELSFIHWQYPFFKSCLPEIRQSFVLLFFIFLHFVSFICLFICVLFER